MLVVEKAIKAPIKRWLKDIKKPTLQDSTLFFLFLPMRFSQNQ